jgi:hypothetical protein
VSKIERGSAAVLIAPFSLAPMQATENFALAARFKCRELRRRESSALASEKSPKVCKVMFDPLDNASHILDACMPLPEGYPAWR